VAPLFLCFIQYRFKIIKIQRGGYMISFLRELAALPIKLLFWICHFLRLPAKLNMAALVWKISREPSWANTWIMLMYQQEGMGGARRLAEQLLDRYKDARVAHQIGTMELMFQKDPAAADKWIRIAETMNCRHQEELLYLKLLLAEHISLYNADHIVQELLARNDMPMEYSRAARLAQTEIWLRKGQWQKADEILDAMLKIESMPMFYIYKWITSLAMGRSKQADDNLSAAQRSFGGPQFLFYEALGWFYLGREDLAKTLLEQAIRGGIDVRDIYLSSPRLSALIPMSLDQSSCSSGEKE
jgi:hypothetical protein